MNPTLHEKYPNTEFFLIRIFPHLDWIRRDTEYLSVFSPNAGKYEPEKTPYLNTFHAVLTSFRKSELNDPIPKKGITDGRTYVQADPNSSDPLAERGFQKSLTFVRFFKQIFVQQSDLSKKADMLFNIYYLILYPRVPATPS